MKTKDQIDREIEWESENEILDDGKGPICPYCGYEDDDYWEWAYTDDGDLEHTECGRCEKEFTFYHEVSHSWTSAPIHPEFNPPKLND